MSQELFLLMCEQMGWEPNPEEMPLEPKDLSYEAQVALTLFQVLPDKIEGMNGVWLGKDFAGLGDIMELYGIEGNREAFNLLLHIIAEASKFYEQQRKVQQARKG